MQAVFAVINVTPSAVYNHVTSQLSLCSFVITCCLCSLHVRQC